MHVGDIALFVLFPNVCEWIFYYIRWLSFVNIKSVYFDSHIFVQIKPRPFPKTTNGRRFRGKYGIILAKVGSSSVIPLAHTDFFYFGRPTNSVSVEPSYNFSCIGGRFLQLKQSLNSPSNNPRSSSDHRLSVNIYNLGIILNVDRRHRWTFLQIVRWTADRIRILLTWLNIFEFRICLWNRSIKNQTVAQWWSMIERRSTD